MSLVKPSRPDVRARLLEAAARVLAAEGPSALTVSRLARELGSSTMVLYSNFTGKEALIAATADEFVSRFSAALRAVPRRDDPLGEFLDLARAYREISLANPHLYRVAFQRGCLSVREDTPSGIAEIFTYVSQVLGRCVAQGALSPGDPDAMLLLFWTAIHGQISLELERVFPSPEAADEAWAALFRATLVGLGANANDIAGRMLATVARPKMKGPNKNKKARSKPTAPTRVRGS